MAKPRRKRSLFPAGYGGGNSYDAAKANDLTYSWSAAPLTADDLVRTSWVQLAARAREQHVNNDYLRKATHMFRNNIVGPNGFQIRPQSQYADGRIDSKANRALAKWWHEVYSRPAFCDFYGRSTLTQICGLIMNHIVVDGEALIQYVTRREDYGCKIKLIDPTLLDFSYSDHKLTKRQLGGRNVRFGIEYNADWQPVAYWFRDKDGEVREHGRRLERIAASNVQHIFVPSMAGQKRGLSWAGTALMRLKMLDGFEDAAVVKARTAASDHGYISMPSPDGFEGDEVDPDGDRVLYGEANAMRIMPEGTQIQTVDHDWPNGEYPGFLKGMLRGVASSLGVSYSALASDFESVNFSAAKLDRAEERDLWVCLQEWFSGVVLDEMYRRALPFGLLRGIPLSPQANLSENLVEKYLPVKWQGRRWGGIENEKDAKADEIHLRNGTTSRHRIARRLGFDLEDIAEELRIEHEEMGFTPLNGSADNPEPQPAPNDDAEDDDDENE